MNTYIKRMLPDDAVTLIARIEIDYIHSVFLSDSIICRTRMTAVGNSSMTMESEILKSDGTVCARAKTVSVLVTKERKKIRIPDSVRNLVN